MELQRIIIRKQWKAPQAKIRTMTAGEIAERNIVTACSKYDYGSCPTKASRR